MPVVNNLFVMSADIVNANFRYSFQYEERIKEAANIINFQIPVNDRIAVIMPANHINTNVAAKILFEELDKRKVIVERYDVTDTKANLFFKETIDELFTQRDRKIPEKVVLLLESNAFDEFPKRLSKNLNFNKELQPFHEISKATIIRAGDLLYWQFTDPEMIKLNKDKEFSI